eukprot:scaffold3711_cov163-Isochrysis_galbana.AAC.2
MRGGKSKRDWAEWEAIGNASLIGGSASDYTTYNTQQKDIARRRPTARSSSRSRSRLHSYTPRRHAYMHKATHTAQAVAQFAALKCDNILCYTID